MLSSYKKANQEIILLLQCLITKKGLNCHGTCNDKFKTLWNWGKKKLLWKWKYKVINKSTELDLTWIKVVLMNEGCSKNLVMAFQGWKYCHN
jgi:hypothetical protein